MMPHDFTFCARLERQLQPWLDGALTPGETALLQGHLAICESCRSAAERHRDLWSLLGQLPVRAPSPAFRRRVLAALPVPASRATWVPGVAVALVFLAGGGAALFSVLLSALPGLWPSDDLAEDPLLLLDWSVELWQGYVGASLDSPYYLLGSLSLLLLGAGWTLFIVLRSAAGSRPVHA
ncbi:MAG: zf-HC2 domain-containing protein [Chloroflexi bacterium]|nr:zf-HC2 domain-containing protein [Chloroflexota bacterium]